MFSKIVFVFWHESKCGHTVWMQFYFKAAAALNKMFQFYSNLFCGMQFSFKGEGRVMCFKYLLAANK